MLTLFTLGIICLVAVVAIPVVLLIIGLPLMLLLGLLPWLLRVAAVILLIKALLAPLRAQVEPMVFGAAYAEKKTRLVSCTLGYRAGVIGAASLR